MREISRLTADGKIRVSREMMHLMDSWQVDGPDRVRLLGLPDGTKPRHLQRYRDGVTALPDDPFVWERVEHLMGIADALHTTFPMNRNMGTLWLRKRNQRLGKQTPLRTMLDKGLEGVVEVRTQLDCAFGWHLDDVRSGKLQG